jgi:hypothetical protein
MQEQYSLFIVTKLQCLYEKSVEGKGKKLDVTAEKAEAQYVAQ